MSLHKLRELVMVREVSWLGKSMGFQRVGHDWVTELNLRWGRSPGGGNGNLLQYSCLKNPIDRGAWWTTVHRSQRVVQDWATVHTHTHTQKCTFLQFLNTTSSSFWPIWFLVRTLFLTYGQGWSRVILGGGTFWSLLSYLPILIVILFTIPKRWEQPTCPSVDEWIDKPGWNIIQPQNCKEILTHATTWMYHKDIYAKKK